MPRESRKLWAEASYATFHFMSWNETGGFYRAMDEEYLLEIIDQLKIALKKDLANIRV